MTMVAGAKTPAGKAHLPVMRKIFFCKCMSICRFGCLCGVSARHPTSARQKSKQEKAASRADAASTSGSQSAPLHLGVKRGEHLVDKHQSGGEPSIDFLNQSRSLVHKSRVELRQTCSGKERLIRRVSAPDAADCNDGERRQPRVNVANHCDHSPEQRWPAQAARLIYGLNESLVAYGGVRRYDAARAFFHDSFKRFVQLFCSQV